jgi:H+/Cl- antiporter ClcA
MSATFAAPVASVLLAVELLLFEWKPRSMIPVALASVTTRRFDGTSSASDRSFRFPNIRFSSAPKASSRASSSACSPVSCPRC